MGGISSKACNNMMRSIWPKGSKKDLTSFCKMAEFAHICWVVGKPDLEMWVKNLLQTWELKLSFLAGEVLLCKYITVYFLIHIYIYIYQWSPTMNEKWKPFKHSKPHRVCVESLDDEKLFIVSWWCDDTLIKFKISTILFFEKNKYPVEI